MFVLDINDNPPKFPFEVKVENIPEVSETARGEGPGAWPQGSVHGGQGHSQTTPPAPPRTLK